MQPDQGLYEEMARRGSRGCRLWRVGTWLRITGLLGIGFVLLVWPAVLFFGVLDAGMLLAILILLMGAVFMLGNFLKKLSYRIALGEGIDIAEYLDKPEEEKKGKGE